MMKVKNELNNKSLVTEPPSGKSPVTEVAMLLPVVTEVAMLLSPVRLPARLPVTEQPPSDKPPSGELEGSDEMARHRAMSHQVVGGGELRATEWGYQYHQWSPSHRGRATSTSTTSGVTSTTNHATKWRVIELQTTEW